MSQTENINNTFFAGCYKDVWRQMVPAGLTEAETTFIQEVAALEPGHHVLDLMCGYGRHALELARRGFAVTAIDNLEEYVREIEEKAAADNLPVQPVLSDVIQAELSGTYDAVVSMGNSFSFFNEADTLKLLSNLARHLKKGGKLLINSWMIGEIVIRHFREKEWYYVGQYKCVLESRYLFNPTRVETDQYIFDEAGGVELTKGIDYIFTIAELQALFGRAGFVLQDIYSTPKRKPFRFGDTRAYLVAERR